MLEKLREWVRRWLGLRVSQDNDSPDGYVKAYEDITGEDITATIAGKLAKLAFADSTMDVTAPGAPSEGELPARAALVRDQLDALWLDGDRIVAQMLGKGGKVLVPTVSGGRLRVNVIDQNRLLIRQKDGNRITAASLLLDRERVDGTDYFLMADYELRQNPQAPAETGVHVIRYRAVRDGGEPVPMDAVARWAQTVDEMTVSHVDRLLFAFLRCPQDNRTDVQCHGVPITYGHEALLKELVEHANIYRREYKLTRPMLGLDSTLWRDNYESERNIGAVRRSVQDSDDPFVPLERTSLDGGGIWQYYAPPIRHEAMEARWQYLCRRMEKACGLSQGILTERQSVNYANKDEVRAAMYDTFSVVKAVRAQWERAMDDVAYAIDVLAEFYGLTPAGSRGQYEIEYDWDTSMIESTAEAFQQLLEGQAIGAIDAAEVRQWIRGGTLDEAREAIAQMRGGAQGAADAGDDDIARILAGGAAAEE